ncbi:MAG: substrate-binding domain-containing protein [Caldilineaceae bacterium]
MGYTSRNGAPKATITQTVLMLVRSDIQVASREMSLAAVEHRLSNGVIDACQHYGAPTLIRPIKMTEQDVGQVAADASLLGAIFLGGMVKAEFARMMQASDLPFIVVGAAVTGVAMNSITADYAAGAEEAVHHLAKQGRQRIGLVNGSSQTSSSLAKFKGYRLALALHNLAYEPNLYQEGDFSSESGYAATIRLLNDVPELDAILYASDEMAIGGLHALKEAGRKTPSDVAVVGYHNQTAAQFTDPPLTSVEVDLYQMGQLAAHRLHQMSQEEPRQIYTISVPTTLCIRQSA